MKKILIFSAAIASMSFTAWQSDFAKAKAEAKATHKMILLNFSGSDWCGPCMRMKREIFNDSSFTRMADTALVLVNADFPRNKKNKLTAELQKQNNLLADKFNPDGKFPFTLLIDEDGKVIKTWDGLPTEKAGTFSIGIASIYHVVKK